uniref:Addiction module component n=1 Tax=Candidatus Kentrum sp. TC TaxID=2126339 RepID=A0A450ZA19_9GAMM|nr:MAG: hypothetical protein BECKTC1821D_GA0114238_11159 [Candidatus Kentron sp. TC]
MNLQQRARELDSGTVRPVPSEKLEGTLNEWTSEADEEASREAIKETLRKTRGSMKLGKTPEDVDAEIRIMRDGWERTWE